MCNAGLLGKRVIDRKNGVKHPSAREVSRLSRLEARLLLPFNVLLLLTFSRGRNIVPICCLVDIHTVVYNPAVIDKTLLFPPTSK